MPRGRPRLPGTEAERADARRAKVRQNVQAFRARQRSNKQVVISSESDSSSTPESSNDSTASSNDSKISSINSSPPVANKSRKGWSLSPQNDGNDRPDESLTTLALIKPNQDRNLIWPPPSASSVSIKIPISPDANPEYRKAFLALFHDRYHPDTSSSPQPRNATPLQLIANIPCSSWVESACYMFGDDASATLSEATLAAALAVIGAERSQQEISIESLRIYLVAMKKIRKDLFRVLKDPQHKMVDLRPLFLASFACANVEFICNNNLVNMLEHIKGMGSLISQRGVEAMRPPDMRIFLYEFRVIDSCFCLIARKSSFLCRPEWINTPWRNEPEHQAIPVQSLLDIGYLIPPLLESYDKAHESNSALENRIRLLPVIEAINQELIDWVVSQVSFIEMDPAVIGTQRSTGTNDYPWTRSFAYPFRLLTWSMIAALVTWLPYRMMLLDMFISIQVEKGKVGGEQPEDVKQRILDIAAARWEVLQLAREVRRCTPYFLEKDKKIIGYIMTLFPFQTAYFEFLKARERCEEQENMSKEELHQLDDDISWCRKLTLRYIKRGFNVQMLELSSQLRD